jgi:hypothetical protein
MSEIRISVWIGRPPPEVFARLTDVSLWPKWQSGLVQVKRISLGPPRAGSQVRVIRAGRQPAISLVQLTQVMPSELLGLKGTSRGLPWQRHFTLAGERGGTRVRLEYQTPARGSTWLFHALPARLRLEGELRRFKSLVEAS